MPRAAVIEEPGRLNVREVQIGSLEPGSTIIDVELTEVCGTDIHLLHGQLDGVPYPLVPGHFACGTVRHTEGETRAVDGAILQRGERVAYLDVHGTCGRCWYCEVAHATTRCPERRVYGITLGADRGALGGWCEQMHLLPGTRIVRLGALSPEAFIGGGCGLATALHAVERAGIQLGDTVAVLGAGPVGLNAAFLARFKGAVEVLLIGGPVQRLQVGLERGVDAVLDLAGTSSEERVAWVRDRTGGRGADVVIEATGVPGAVIDGMRMAREAGQLMVVGQYTDAGDAIFNPHRDLNRRHLDVRGVWGIDYGHLHRSLRILTRYEPELRWSRLLSDPYGLDAAATALDDVAAGRVIKAALRPSK